MPGGNSALELVTGAIANSGSFLPDVTKVVTLKVVQEQVSN